MRRKDREVTDMGRIIAILDQARIVHLGLIDGEAPYVVPLHYGYTLEDGKLTFFMHGATEGRICFMEPVAAVELVSEKDETPEETMLPLSLLVKASTILSVFEATPARKPPI